MTVPAIVERSVAAASEALALRSELFAALRAAWSDASWTELVELPSAATLSAAAETVACAASFVATSAVVETVASR